MPTYRLSPNAKQQFFTNEGTLAAGYLLYTYAANSDTPITTYVAQDGGDNTNPIVLDARGEADIWLDPNLFYKYKLTDPDDAEIWTVDYVSSGEGSGGDGGTSIVTGQCILVYTNPTTLTLARRNGSKLYINDTEEDIPSDGVTLDTTGLSVNTTYNIFAYMVDDVMTLIASVDAHISRATNGIEIRQSESPNGVLYSYVGSAFTISSSGTKWLDYSVVSWFNTPPVIVAIEMASTSGTSVDFIGIPSQAKRIEISFKGVSTNGTDNLLFQLGDAGGVETTGYLGAGSQTDSTATVAAYTNGFGIISTSASAVIHGTIAIVVNNESTFSWAANGTFAASNGGGATWSVAGVKSLSAALDRVRVTTTGGTNTFDAGAMGLQLYL